MTYSKMIPKIDFQLWSPLLNSPIRPGPFEGREFIIMWEQGKGVTVAFNNCQAKCEGDAFSYLWPILVDPRNGRCA